VGFDKLSEMKPEKQSSTCHVATFHNDFGAISFERRLKKLGDSQERLMPVPRQVSASCGLGVEFFIPFDPKTMPDENTDSVYQSDGDSYQLVFENK
jgi:hypothetical protein